MKKVILISAAFALALMFVFILELPYIPITPFEGCGPPG